MSHRVSAWLFLTNRESLTHTHTRIHGYTSYIKLIAFTKTACDKCSISEGTEKEMGQNRTSQRDFCHFLMRYVLFASGTIVFLLNLKIGSICTVLRKHVRAYHLLDLLASGVRYGSIQTRCTWMMSSFSPHAAELTAAVTQSVFHCQRNQIQELELCLHFTSTTSSLHNLPDNY